MCLHIDKERLLGHLVASTDTDSSAGVAHIADLAYKARLTADMDDNPRFAHRLAAMATIVVRPT
jgi:hypothetical protein